VGHLGYFHSLAVVTSAAINMGVQVPLLYPDYILSSLSLGVELLNQMAVLFLGSQGGSLLLSIVAVLIYIPTSSV
jgi:hypothetical protein